MTWAVSPADQNGPDGRSTVEAELDPGATRADHLAVRNLSDVDVTFTLSAADGYLTPSGRFNMLPSNTPSVASGTWISIPNTVDVAAGATAVVPFSITVPPNAEPGDHAAGIAASISSESTTGGTTIGVESRVGFRVMTRVTGTVMATLATSATASYLTSWNPLEPGQVDITYTLHNTGNVRLNVTAFTQSGDQQTPAVETADAPIQLLPGDTRIVHATVAGVWPVGPVTLPLTARYSIVEADGSETQAETVDEDVTAWAMPWPQLASLLALLLIAAGILGGRLRHHRNMNRRLEEAREAGRREAQTV